MEVSETQLKTLETGEMSHEDGRVSVLADWVLPSASCAALRVSAQIEEEEVTRGTVPLSMSLEEHMIYNCRSQTKMTRRGKVFQRINFYQNRACRVFTYAGDSDESDSDRPLDLDWTHDSDDEGPHVLLPSSESETERESPKSLGDSELEDLLDKTIAQNSNRGTLLLTCAEIIALQVIDGMRLQSQSTVDNLNVIHPHGSIGESRASTDDGIRGGRSG